MVIYGFKQAAIGNEVSFIVPTIAFADRRDGNALLLALLRFLGKSSTCFEVASDQWKCGIPASMSGSGHVLCLDHRLWRGCVLLKRLSALFVMKSPEVLPFWNSFGDVQ